jgi:hypothetical protein
MPELQSQTPVAPSLQSVFALIYRPPKHGAL